MSIPNRGKKVCIAGGGPAGASLAIRLAGLGCEVTLVEREVFPRHKLCGEFISPESIAHFKELGLSEKLISAGGDRILKTIFYSIKGANASVPSEWFSKGSDGALGLSRAAMDEAILRRAAECGVQVFEGTTIKEVVVKKHEVSGILVRREGTTFEIGADLFVDATGRDRVVSKLASRAIGVRESPVYRKWIGFKSHFEQVQMEPGRCEIYLFEGGYGGLNYVENGIANHCFLMQSSTVKKYGSDPNEVFRDVVLSNKRAAETMSHAKPLTEWIAVAIDEFGNKKPTPFSNLVAAGDSGNFIDPFTGSGMLMAFQSSQLLADAVERCPDITSAAALYKSESRKLFAKRLRVSGIIRRLSFSPRFAGLLINSLKYSRSLTKAIAVATRHGS